MCVGLHEVNFVLIWRALFLQMQPVVVCTFPIGEVRAEVEKDEERAIARSGFFGGSLLNAKVLRSKIYRREWTSKALI